MLHALNSVLSLPLPSYGYIVNQITHTNAVLLPLMTNVLLLLSLISIRIESKKTTSMEDVSTGVLVEIKNI